VGDSRKLDPMTEKEVRAYREFLRKMNESAPAASEAPSPGGLGERYRYILESIRALTIDIDTDGRVAHVSPSISRVLGYEPEEWIGKEAFDWIHPDDLSQLALGVKQLRTSDDPVHGVARVRHHDGHYVWMETSGTRAQDHPGGTVMTVIFLRDITQRKRTADALIEHEDRLRALTEHASDIIAEVDSEGRVIYLSPSFEQALGRTRDEVVGKTFAEVGIAENLHPDDLGNLSQRFEQGLGAGDLHKSRLAYRFRHANGEWRWFESETTPYLTQDGEVRKVVVSRDVTERIEAIAELQESEERYRILANSTLDMIVELDDDAQIRFVSSSCQTVLGYPPEMLIGRSGFTIVHPDDIEKHIDNFIGAAKEEGAIGGEPYRARHHDGSWRWLEGVGVSFRRADGEMRVLSVTRDITQRIEAEAQQRDLEENLRRVQRLESLGVMAGGIAHDFNNLLTPILGNASLALLDLPRNSPARTQIERIRGAALRAAALTNQMLAYAGSEPVAVEPVDLSHVVRELTPLLESSIAGQTTVIYQLADDLPAVEADDAQVGQVVLNLLTNAVESIDEGAGRITIETGTLEIDGTTNLETAFGDTLEYGTYVFLAVSDNGCGMDAETRARIFDPFFTTKFTGRGLGLAAVMGVVRGHGGAIDIDSQVGKGSRFRVLFRCVSRDSDRPDSESYVDPVLDWRGSGTVLVVDDDEAVRELISAGLQRVGFDVLQAGDGQEGIAIFEQHRDEIRAVFLDRTMPNVSGEEAFEAIRRIDPDARVVLASGYSEKQAAEKFADRGLVGFLQKPFRIEALIKKLRQALDE
jgi:two-component system cell cycle sensor histidine kinase/response regulator CckA